MAESVSIPHRRAHGMCPVNGIRDVIQWRTGRDWSNEFVHGLGQGGGFAYLRINVADPPRQVYWGIATPRQHEYLAQLLGGTHAAIEGRSFKTAWDRARVALDAGTPPILGPLDMFHLHYYPGLYHQRHIPIHYVLLVGYDAQAARVLDTDLAEVQSVPLDELCLAWDVNAPGLGKRNRVAVVDVPAQVSSDAALVRKSVADACRNMLHPPISMLGIPAMRKLAREIAGWPQELGRDKAAGSLRQMREYLNCPPDLSGDHLTAGRDLYIRFLQEAGPLAGLDLSAAIQHLREAMALIPPLAIAVREERLADAAGLMARIAEEHSAAFTALSTAVGGLEGA